MKNRKRKYITLSLIIILFAIGIIITLINKKTMICTTYEMSSTIYTEVRLTGNYNFVTKKEVYQKHIKRDTNEANDYYNWLIKQDNCYNQTINGNVVEFICVSNLPIDGNYKELRDENGHISYESFKKFFEESGYVCKYV